MGPTPRRSIKHPMEPIRRSRDKMKCSRTKPGSASMTHGPTHGPPNIGSPLKYNNGHVNELLYENGGYVPSGYGKMEALPTASRPPSVGVGLYDTEFHGFLSWSMSVKRLFPSCSGRDKHGIRAEEFGMVFRIDVSQATLSRDMNTRRANTRRMEDEIVNEGVPPTGPQRD
uniref:Uncharacterized protein n=1 Tax=Solanum tuberosum TaxID=4113 RepID=M1DDC2_SOLTU